MAYRARGEGLAVGLVAAKLHTHTHTHSHTHRPQEHTHVSLYNAINCFVYHVYQTLYA